MTLAPTPAAQMADAIRILSRVFTISEDRFPPAEGRMRHNAIDFQSLGFIADRPGAGGVALAKFLGVAPTTAQSALDRLVRAGLVARYPHAKDRRAMALTLTPQGQVTIEAIRRQDEANCALMLQALAPEAQAAFVSSLRAIAASLESHEG
jgi:DNA-binding MarR family transcriptional regulator